MLRNKSKIEFAKFSDVVEISNLSKKYIEHDLRQHYTPEQLKKSMDRNNKNIVVARVRDKLVGFGIMTYHDDRANLDLLAVKLFYRRRGIGRQIVYWLEEVALTAGIFYIFVQARKINRGAIIFYNKLGFEIFEEKSGYYQGKETGVLMSKYISKTKDAT
jgi:ribosomal protein S18 acetylase RimI-like enzyme